MKNLRMDKGLLFFFFATTLIGAGCSRKDGPLFERLPAEATGILFANTISESDSLNILTTEYIYNGGGVAIGDFNNDGLQDVYFTGNMVPNKLYLNKGELAFEDVTDRARVTGEGKWCSGVAVADINNDGWLDIYVGATMGEDPVRRANLLYINNGVGNDGVPTFTEAAAQYGIADTGHTTHAAFFDYDLDGDLDLYVLTNVITAGLPTVYREKVTDGTAENNDRLYRNNGDGTFTNASQEAGIKVEGFGLGLSITDVNQDGWPDIYVTNDYLSNDLLYLNNQDGTFTNRINDYIAHTSFSAMGNDVVDINNDGFPDIIAVDMLPEGNKRKKLMLKENNYVTYINSEKFNFQHQYVRNTLQLHNGVMPDGKMAFSEIAQLSGIHQTDWSWAPLVADFDNDGLRDIIITNGFPRDVTDHDFALYRSGPAGNVASNTFLVDSIPVVKIPNYAYRNNGDLTFTDLTKEWGLDIPSFSNGGAYADLDNDGDLDLVVNNINEPALVFRNRLYETKAKEPKNHFLRVKPEGEGANPAGLGTKIRIHYGGGQQQYYEHTLYRGYLSTVEPVAHFGLGKNEQVDSVQVFWPDGRYQLLREVPADRHITVRQADARERVPVNQLGGEWAAGGKTVFREVSSAHGIRFRHQEDDKIDFNIQRTLPHKYSQNGPGIAVGDVDGNGLDDFFVGGSADRGGTLFLQQKEGVFKMAAGNGGLESKAAEDQGLLFFDADGDGDLDLYVVSGSYEYRPGAPEYQDRLYRNNGQGQFTLDPQALPPISSSGSCVRAADFDQDGDLDLFVGGRVEPGAYPMAPQSFLLRNEGGRFTDATAQAAPGLERLGMVTDALWTDFDHDGQVDLVLAGEWMPLTFFKNEKGALRNVTAATGTSHLKGWWNSIVAGDFDGDGDMDYVAGNLGLNTTYKGTEEYPMWVYAKDFDQNGSIDPVLACYLKGEDRQLKLFPVHHRDDLSAQMIRTRKQFRRYGQYGTATIEQVLSPEDREGALVLEANHLASSYFENLGDGTFRVSALPVEAQVAPVYGMVARDFNGDGNLDLLLAGNSYATETITGRHDAAVGLYLIGNGKGGFRPQRMTESGFLVKGDAKGMAVMYGSQGEELVVVTQNQDSLRMFSPASRRQESASSPHVVTLAPLDAWAEITYRNGRKERREFYYGSGYLSQSSRLLALDPEVVGVTVYDFQGRRRDFNF